MIDALSSDTISLVKLALDVAQQNQKILANNIANINAKNFEPLKMDFAAIFDGHLELLSKNGDVEGIDAVRKEVASGDFVEKTIDKPTIESQVVSMTDNVVRYKALINAVNARGDIMNMAIKTRNA